MTNERVYKEYTLFGENLAKAAQFLVKKNRPFFYINAHPPYIKLSFYGFRSEQNKMETFFVKNKILY